MPNIKQEKGITMAALILMIILMLILVTVSVSIISGSDGVVNNTKKIINLAEQDSLNEKIREEIKQEEIKAKLLGQQISDDTILNIINSYPKFEYDTEEKILYFKDENEEKTIFIELTNLRQEITIKYNSNGGIGSMSDSVVIVNTTVQLKENKYTKTGYFFNGWKDQEGNDYADGAEITPTGDLLLNAQWIKEVYDFDYVQGIEKEQTFTVPVNGIYKLEVWGAQGGNIHNLATTSNNSATNGNISKRGGYGGYSVGNIYLTKNNALYINVGGKGTDSIESTQNSEGGYNGGGTGGSGTGSYNCYAGAGGGGATHIATQTGMLQTLSTYKDTAGPNKSNEILIVAGGGGGAINHNSHSQDGGNGGGYIGCIGTTNRDGYSSVNGGTQSTGYAFGLGETGIDGISVTYSYSGSGGGGGGFFGGHTSTEANHRTSGAGGSGYIGSPLLSNKKMVIYATGSSYISNDTDTKTETTQNVSSNAISNYAKTENGYARITLLSISE